MLDLLPVMGEPRGLWACWKERRLNPRGLHQVGDDLRDTQSLSKSQTQPIPPLQSTHTLPFISARKGHSKYHGQPRTGFALQPERGSCSLATTKAEAVHELLTISRWVGVSRPDGYPWLWEAARRPCEWLFEGLRLASSCSFHCGALVRIMPRAWGEREKEGVMDRAEVLQREPRAATCIRLGTRQLCLWEWLNRAPQAPSSRYPVVTMTLK